MGGKGSGGYRKNALPRDKNPVLQTSDPSNVDRATNSRVMAFGRDIMAFDPPDFSDAESVRQRFYDYIEMCDRHGIRPMVTSMANAFGMSRRELYEIVVGARNAARWRGGVLTPESKAVLQKCYNFLNTAWETYLMDEKGNPVKWLFLGKNYFGMKDQTERVQVNHNVEHQLPKPEDVASKYAAMVGRPVKGELEQPEVVYEEPEDQ